MFLNTFKFKYLSKLINELTCGIYNTFDCLDMNLVILKNHRKVSKETGNLSIISFQLNETIFLSLLSLILIVLNLSVSDYLPPNCIPAHKFLMSFNSSSSFLPLVTTTLNSSCKPLCNPFFHL